jgi:hypothetical protein
LLLTVAIAADGYEIGSVPGTGDAAQASLLPITIVKGKKVYHPDGTFKGCEVGGDNCWMIATAYGAVTVSSEGLAVQ